jgi:O-acetyl-ADP-ribose deacetylase (regulator of RNase III)
MIEYRHGDILQADAEALVNTVNCVGIMGRGIALQFRKAFPGNYKLYKAVCDRNDLQPGKMLVYDLNRFENPRLIINFPTKRHWKGKSRLEDVEAGLTALVEEIRQRKIRSVAIPPLGCGLGGLNWKDVKAMIERALGAVPELRAMVYEPAGAPAAERMVKVNQAPKMTISRASLIGLTRRYLSAVLDPSISLLEIHKLMYFMQESGEPLGLKYKKATYGPYAENLRHVLSAIEGHLITGYGDAADTPKKQIEVMPDAWDLADAFLRDHSETRRRFDRVADLIKGFETSYGMELLSTVHWVAAKEGAAQSDEVVSGFYAWNDRKHMFKERQIRLALDVLKEKGWV